MEAGKENPNLTDNWDDAEGYYSKIHKLSFFSIILTTTELCSVLSQFQGSSFRSVKLFDIVLWREICQQS